MDFGVYIQSERKKRGLPLRKVAANLDIDTSTLSKIERGDRQASIEHLPIFAEIFEIDLRNIEVEYIYSVIKNQLGKLKNLKEGLQTTINRL
jgi:transcriptional regulator with XRE-family HTH domain